MKLKYAKNTNENAKEEAAKLIAITTSQSSPYKEQRVTEFLEDSIAMGLDTGDAKEMMIAELGNEL